MTAPASNRQRKVLRFFGIEFSPDLTLGGANWEIAALLNESRNRDRWRRYVYLTGDHEVDTDDLVSFDPAELDAVELPPDWTVSIGREKYRDELIAEEMIDGAPFDHPAPAIAFHGRHFMFTGKFAFGSRDACEAAVRARGGIANRIRRPTSATDYVVVGVDGSAAWKRSAYGSKLEAAILLRRVHGRPAIVSEAHWNAALGED